MQFRPCQTQLTDPLNDNYIPQAQYYIIPSYMDFVHGKWGSIIFILRRSDPVLFPHLSSPGTVEGFPPSAITQEVFHQRADEVRIIMNSFTLKDAAFLLCVCNIPFA